MAQNDPFEEFEFKPLTEGLGFHKKKTEAPIDTSPLIEPLLKDQGLSLLGEETQPFSSPLPRKGNLVEPTLNLKINEESDTNSQLDEILKNIQKNKRFEVEPEKTTLKQPTTETYKATALSLSAGFLDSMLVVAASLLCMIILLVITRVDLVGSLSNPASDKMIYVATVALFASVYLIYMMANRVFLGYTPGEWAFDHRIGTPSDMQKWSYTPKVFVRSLITVATGFIILPILSAIFQQDFAGRVSGAAIVKKV